MPQVNEPLRPLPQPAFPYSRSKYQVWASLSTHVRTVFPTYPRPGPACSIHPSRPPWFRAHHSLHDRLCSELRTVWGLSPLGLQAQVTVATSTLLATHPEAPPALPHRPHTSGSWLLKEPLYTFLLSEPRGRELTLSGAFRWKFLALSLKQKASPRPSPDHLPCGSFPKWVRGGPLHLGQLPPHRPLLRFLCSFYPG